MAAAFLLAGCNVVTSSPEPSETVVMQRPDAVVVPGAVFDTIAVQVRDASGQPVPGVRVDWSGDGEVTPFATHTDDVGIARARWVLPGRDVQTYTDPVGRTGASGDYSISATVIGLGTTHIGVAARAFTVDTVDASHNYACGLRGTELWCWGAQVPLSPTPGRATRRVNLPAGLAPTAVIAADEMLCVLDQASRPHCAIPLHGDRFDPIKSAPGLRNVGVTDDNMCGVALSDGSIWCWEAGYHATHGQTAERVQPGPFVAFAGGWDAACGLAADGVVSCWGANDRGQLGDGTNTPRTEASPVSGEIRFATIAAGQYKFCGSATDSVIWCWGRLEANVERNVPERIDVPWLSGPDFRVGLVGELYGFPDGHVRVHGVSGAILSQWFGEHRIRQFSLDHSACLRNMQDEVYCSWDLFRRVITHAWLPLEPVPVPPPPSDGS